MATIPKQPEVTDGSQVSEAALIFWQDFVANSRREFMDQVQQNPLANALDYPELAKLAVQIVLDRGVIVESRDELPKPASWAEQLRDYLVNPLP